MKNTHISNFNWNKYNSSLILSIILEKKKIIKFSNVNINNNNIFLMCNKNSIKVIIFLLKYEFFLNKSSLIDSSVINYNFNNNNLFFKKSNIYANVIYYNFFNLNNKSRIFIISFLKKKIQSFELVFNNLNWIEREISEMYGIFFFIKKDNRKLLLDYSKTENPLLKNFQLEGKNEIFFNFFNYQVEYINNLVIEI